MHGLNTETDLTPLNGTMLTYVGFGHQRQMRLSRNGGLLRLDRRGLCDASIHQASELLHHKRVRAASRLGRSLSSPPESSCTPRHKNRCYQRHCRAHEWHDTSAPGPLTVGCAGAWQAIATCRRKALEHNLVQHEEPKRYSEGPGNDGRPSREDASRKHAPRYATNRPV